MITAFHHLVQQGAADHPDNLALSYGKASVTYAALWRQSAAAGAGLARLGLARGDRVGIYLDKRIETVAALFGVSAAGGIFVPINPLLRAGQVAFILRDCAVRVLVTSQDRFGLIAEALETCPGLDHVVLVDAAAPAPAGHRFATTCWQALIGKGPAPPVTTTIDFDLAAILYTSGSTGKPKGVVLSHRNLIVGAESVSAYLGNTADDVILAVLPLSFDAGLSQVTTGLRVGAHVVLMNYLVAQDVARLCDRHGVTGLTGVPPLWIQLAQARWPDAAAARLRYFANTGGRMPKPLLESLRARFANAAPFLMYGLTEAFRSTYLDPAEVDRRPGSIGKAIPNAEILVVRPDGSPCDPGEEGELVHRGALVAQGYWNDPQRTAERFRPLPGRQEPWLTPERVVFSGDIVVSDAEGFLYYVGRRDEMIKTSGYRVSPTEIEEAAYRTQLVGDAVAMGVADEGLGQRVVLIASPRDGQPLDIEALLAGMKAHVPAYMVPSEVICRASLPRSANGKFDRTLLRAELGR